MSTIGWLVEGHSPATFDRASTEAKQIALLLRDPQAVATHRRGQPISAHATSAIGIEHVAPAGDITLHQIRSRSRRMVSPHGRRQGTDTDHAVRRQQEKGQQRLPLAATIGNEKAVATYLERAKHPELNRGHRAPPSASSRVRRTYQSEAATTERSR